MNHIVVIGAGPAGMLAAGTAAEQGARVTLLEKMNKPGRKLVITGKGRCNITNLKNWEEFSPHVHPVNRYFKPAFYHFSSEDTVRFFNGIGLPTLLERGSRIYPASERAFDVADALVQWLERLGVDVQCNTRVTGFVTEPGTSSRIKAVRVARNSDSRPRNFSEAVTLPDGADENSTRGTTGEGSASAGEGSASAGEEWEIAADHFILATGGKTYPGTGSTGDGYAFALALGHRVEPLFPTLTALMPVRYDMRLKGIQLRNVGLELVVNGVVKQAEEGELFFTDLGIEGPIGFRVSRNAVIALNSGQQVALHLNLKPALTREQLLRRWERESDRKPEPEQKGEPVRQVGAKQGSSAVDALKLRGFMPGGLVGPFTKYVTESGMHPVDAMQQWVFPITSCEGWRRAVVTAGGISMKEVDSKTMQSRLVENLSFAGEVLDLDADSGGYNLQVAFATGRLAGSCVPK